MLAGQVRREQLSNRTVLDLCTGSGMVAVAAALNRASAVTALDVSRRALLSARLNALVNGVRVETVRGDLLDAVDGRRFDLIATNPPYVPGPAGELPTRGLERAWEAGPDGRAFLDRICAAAPAHLEPGGAILLVHSTICGENETLAALRSGGLQAEVVFRHVGELGPRLRERSDWLQARGLLSDGTDEVIIVRGQRA